MAEESTTADLLIRLNTAEVTGNAETAAKALDELRVAIKADNSEIAQMERALKTLKSATTVNTKEVDDLTKAITLQKQKTAEAQATHVKLGGSFRAAVKPVKPPPLPKLPMPPKAAKADETSKTFEKFAAQARKLPGPLGEIVGKLGDIKSIVAGGDLGFLAITGGLTALVAATAVAIAKLTQLGIAHADARRSEMLHLEALTKMRNFYGVTAGSATEMQAAIDRVAATTAASRADIAGFADELYKGHLRGDNFSQALEGMAIKSTALGPAAAHAFGGFATAVGFAGGSVKRLSDDVKARFGGIVQKQMASLTVQTMKQQEAFDALFNGLNVDKFVTAKKTVSDLLSQTTASGQALKSLMTSLVQPIIDMATKAQPIIKRFFQGMIIEGLRLHIQWLALKIAFKRAFAQPEVIQGIDKTRVALNSGKVVLYALGVALAFAAGAVIAFTWPVLLAGAAIWGLFEVVEDLYAAWKEVDWIDLGKAVGKGIVNGITWAWDAVVSKVSSLATLIGDTFKEKLGIHSPSKVFSDLGLAIPQGVAVGVEAGTPTARNAVDDMLDVPRMPTGGVAKGDAATAPVAGQSAGTANTFTFGDIYLGAKAGGGKEQAHDFVNELARVLEGVSIQFGASTVGATP